jgi:hypothetical protein
MKHTETPFTSMCLIVNLELCYVLDRKYEGYDACLIVKTRPSVCASA